jgi:uncharacterized membrane protein YedE/YeeE
MRAIPSPLTLLALLPFSAGRWWFGPGPGAGLLSHWVLGAAIGALLLAASFSFAAAFRRLIAEGRGAGARAILLALAAGLLLFLPALAAGELFGQPVRGLYFPVGAALILGAFLFGVGMQLGAGCASGTLFTAGTGETRPWLTLLGFVAGATLMAWALPLTEGWAALPPVRLPESLGWAGTLAGGLLLIGLLWLALLALERRRHGAAEPLLGSRAGRWLVAGALGLAVLDFATLWLLGRPWAITSALPLWGSRLLDATGWGDPAFWPYWEEPTRAELLFRPLDQDRTGVMNLGVIAGGALAAGLAGRFLRGGFWPGLRPALAGVLGGGLLGVGAVLSNGCNIGAFLGGAFSGSLHGWLWLPAALAGNALGLFLRPAFGLAGGLTLSWRGLGPRGAVAQPAR